METKDKLIFQVNHASKFKQDILGVICHEVRKVLEKMKLSELMTVEELRLRANKPLMVQNSRGNFFLNCEGRLVHERVNLFYVYPVLVTKTLELISENSIYAFQDEIKNGYLTIKGGHRVGIVGRVILDGYGIKNIKEVSGLNIRFAREVNGCSSKIIDYVLDGEGGIFNTLILSPPQCGKTTMLRDLTRVISDGIKAIGFNGLKIGVVDERSEIAACYKGIPQNGVGVRTDVLDGCPKQLGMLMMLRSMSPDIIVTDEIGCDGDTEAVMQVINAGVKIITTAHGYNISQLKTRKEVLMLIDKKVFDRYIVLSARKGPGTVEEIIDGRTLNVLYKGD